MRLTQMTMAAALLAAASGCSMYSWRPEVPEGARTVAVSTFRNDGDVTEMGPLVAAQVLREFSREGTYRVATLADCALEVQGYIKNAESSMTAYERRTGARNRERRFSATAVVSFIDKRTGKVLVNDRRYTATTTFLVNDDVVTGERGASGRIAEELARQIVDDALSLKW